MIAKKYIYSILNSMKIDYHIQYGRYKNINIKIDSNKNITVNAPYNIDINSIDKSIQSKYSWIVKTLDKIDRRNTTELKVLSDHILLYGEHYKFIRSIGTGKEIMVNHDRKSIFSAINILSNSVELLKFYKREARWYIPTRVKYLANKHNYTVSNIRIKRVKSIYGSCTSNGAITISERLIIAPHEIIDAIILHELLHLKHMNHSADFYNTLYDICPNYKVADKWLKERMPRQYPPL